jgi:hypothetical protein
VAVTVNVAVADEGRDKSRKSAEVGVKLADAAGADGSDTEAPVITKPAGAEICTEPSIWGDASFVTANAKAALAPVAALDGDTATARHLPMQVLEVALAAGAESTAAPSTPAASTPKDTRAMLKPAFGTAHPFRPHQSRDMTASAAKSDSLVHRACMDDARGLRSCDQAVLAQR